MTPGERLVRDANHAIRRDRRRDALDRQRPLTVVGGPRSSAPAGLEALVAKLMAARLAAAPDGKLRLTPDVAAMQQHAPRAPQPVHSGCCHCATRARQQVGANARRAKRGGSRAVSDTMFDAHGHFFGATAYDYIWSVILVWFSPSTATYERLAWLTDDMGLAGVSHMVLSGFADTTLLATNAGDWVLGRADGRPSGLTWGMPEETDWSVSVAASLYPDYFIPFANGFSLNSGGLISEVRARFAAWSGWKGIGEIIVHGHGTDHGTLADSHAIQEVLTYADYKGVPVQLHWDIGAIDPDGTSATDNFIQLSTILDHIPDTTVVILAHCGLGPWKVDDTTTDLEAWKRRIAGASGVTGLLERDNVYLDLGGMQIVGTTAEEIDVLQLMDEFGTDLTEVGRFLLKQMELYPDRFLLGSDVETRSYTEIAEADALDSRHHYGVEQYVASIPDYLTFLELGVAAGLISETTADMVRTTNGEDLFGV